MLILFLSFRRSLVSGLHLKREKGLRWLNIVNNYAIIYKMIYVLIEYFEQVTHRLDQISINKIISGLKCPEIQK